MITTEPPVYDSPEIHAVQFVVLSRHTCIMPKAKKKWPDIPNKGTGKKSKRTPGSGNPWPYKDKLEFITETDLLNTTQVLNLDCKNHYKIRPSVHVIDDKTANDQLF